MRRLFALNLAWVGLALAGCPDNPFAAAEKLAQTGQTQQAANAYLEIARNDPANLAAWDQALDLYCRKLIDVGECTRVLDLELRLLGQLERHRDVLAEVLEARARERLNSGLAQDAIADLNRAAEASPARASIWVVLARAQLAAGQLDLARAALKHAKDLDPHSAEADQLVEQLFPSTEGDAPFGGPNP